MFMNCENLSNKKILATKLGIVSTVQCICSVLIIIYAIRTAKSFQEYGWGINVPGANNLLNLDAQNCRAILLASCTLFLLCVGFSLYFSLGYKKYSFKYLPWLCFFNELLFIYYWLQAWQSQEIKQLLHPDNQLDSSSTIIDWRFKASPNKWVMINTICCLIAFMIFMVGFILIFLNGDTSNNQDPTDIWFINKLSYFTNLSNMACFFYLLVLLCFYQRSTCNSSGIIICLCTYILIVGLVYWILLFPYHISVDEGGTATILWVRRIWLHTVSPLAFLGFTFTSFATKNLQATSFKSISIRGLIYPLTYGLYMYALPFLTQIVIYGNPTNLNPHMILSGESVSQGNPLYVFAIPLAIGIFVLMFWLFYFIYQKMSIKKA